MTGGPWNESPGGPANSVTQSTTRHSPASRCGRRAGPTRYNAVVHALVEPVVDKVDRNEANRSARPEYARLQSSRSTTEAKSSARDDPSAQPTTSSRLIRQLGYGSRLKLRRIEWFWLWMVSPGSQHCQLSRRSRSSIWASGKDKSTLVDLGASAFGTGYVHRRY